MGVDHKIVRHSGQFRGLDKRSSDVDRTIEYSSNMKNAAYRASGSINKRKGYHTTLTNTANSYGLTTFNNIDNTTGAVTEELLMVSDKLYKLVENEFKITRALNEQIATLLDLSSDGVLSGTGTALDPFKLCLPNNTKDLVIGQRVFINSESTLLTVRGVESTRIIDPGNAPNDIIVKKYSLEGTSATLTAQSSGTNTLTLQTSSMWVSLTPNSTGTFDFVLRDLDGDIDIINQNLNEGISTGMTTLALKNIVDTTAGLSATFKKPDGTDITSSDAVESALRAALMDVVSNRVVKAGETFTFKVRQWNVVPDNQGNTNATVFSGFTGANILSEDLENASFATLNNVLYIANGTDELMKYDGSSVYRAGVPEPETFTVSGQGAGTQGNTNTYFYGIIYKFTDAKLNTFSSRMKTLEVADVQSPDSNNIIINLPDIIKTGFKNSSISVEIYRTVAGAGLAGPFYKIETRSYSASDTFTDNRPDTNDPNAIDDLNNAYILPGDLTHDLPPKGKYLSVYKNSLVVSGQPTNVNNVSFSLAASEILLEKGSEAFPSATNQILVESSFGDRISAIASLRDSLFVFHKNSIHALIGEINDDQGVTFISDLITKEGQLGCESNSSILEISNKLMFLSRDGLYTIDTSSKLEELSSLIHPLFINSELKLKRTVSKAWTDEQLIIIQIPTEGADNNNIYSTSDSLVVAYDLVRAAWLQWDNIDLAGGCSVFKDKLFFNSRGVSKANLSCFSKSETEFDYADHAVPIQFSYDTNWESLNEPTVFKKFLRLKLYSFDQDKDFESSSFDLRVSIQKNYIDTDTGGILFDFGKSAANGWGLNPWGQEPWGDATLSFMKTKLPTGKSNCIKLRFSNVDINENVLVSKYELEIAAPFRTEIKE